MKLSVLLSGIRHWSWERLYDSIERSYTGRDWELIIVSPYELTLPLKNKNNILWIQDWGTPIRCQQIALNHTRGEYINWASDDGYFTDGSMDIGFKLLDGDYKTVIIGKYLEGDNYSPNMKDDSYYLLNNHIGSMCKYLPDNTPLLNVGLVSRKLLLEVGGWDAKKFEVCPYAYNDLSVRLRNYNCKFIHQQEVMFICGHMPGETGDHGPVHRAQIFRDEPMFKVIYNKEDSKNRINIDLDNWKNSPEKWQRRFGT